jgi:hypothetical protein
VTLRRRFGAMDKLPPCFQATDPVSLTTISREKTMKLQKSALALLALVSVGGAAIAQEAGMPRQMTVQPNQGAANPAMACAADQHVDGQLAFIKAELRITDEQSPVWNVFAEAFRADKQKKTASCLAAQEQARTIASANLLDSMKLMETRLTEQLDSLRAMDAAVRPLYGMLSKEQRKKADEILKGAPGL